jgi:hypothetical protein
MTDAELVNFKKRATPFVENIAESTSACLLTMVQGNVLALGLGHWLIASQTGIVAGSIASLAIVIARTEKREVVAAVLGAFTGTVDYFVHPGNFGPAGLEAIATGICAGVLSYAFSTLVHLVRGR